MATCTEHIHDEYPAHDPRRLCGADATHKVVPFDPWHTHYKCDEHTVNWPTAQRLDPISNGGRGPIHPNETREQRAARDAAKAERIAAALPDRSR